MDADVLKKLARGDTTEKSSSFSQSSSGKRASADESLVTRFNNKDVGFFTGVVNSVGEQFNVSPSTILLPVWAFVFTSLFLTTQYVLKNYQIHVMVPERTHTLSATKLVEVRACHPRPCCPAQRQRLSPPLPQTTWTIPPFPVQTSSAQGS